MSMRILVARFVLVSVLALAVHGASIRPATAEERFSAGPERIGALQASISVGDVMLTVYPLGTVLVEMPVGNPTVVQQTFQLRMLLLDAAGSEVTTHLTEVVRLRPGVSEWLAFTIQRANGARSVLFDIGLFGTPSDAPLDLRSLSPADLANPR